MGDIERSQASKVVIAADKFSREVRRNGMTGKAAELRNEFKAEVVALDRQHTGAVDRIAELQRALSEAIATLRANSMDPEQRWLRLLDPTVGGR